MGEYMLKTSGTLLACILLAFSCCARHSSEKPDRGRQAASLCNDSCMAQNTSRELTCTLTSPELRKRKETIIASLKRQALETRALKNGYAFKFPGTDQVLDELTEFIKTERQCCSFFTFGLSVSGDAREAWLELTGPDGAKDFIVSELGLAE